MTYSTVSYVYDAQCVKRSGNHKEQNVITTCSLSASGKLRVYWYPADSVKLWQRQDMNITLLVKAGTSWHQSLGSKPWEIMTDIQSGNVAVQRNREPQPCWKNISY